MKHSALIFTSFMSVLFCLTAGCGEQKNAETDQATSLPASVPVSVPDEPKLDPLQEGIARWEALPGNTMEFECVLLSGDKLSLKDLDGKVVLIDFWASWCPPCRAEVPGMKVAYEQFHDLGFEIIGYNVDWDSGEDVEFLKDYVEKESIPWHVSSAPACEEAGLVNYSEHYGVQSIPTMILIGKDGKVISIEARGEKLISELEKIFGQ